jgi:DNA mismatch endonuclease, patch repair protein
MRSGPTVTTRVPASPGPSSRSANQRANRRRDTGPERLLRSELHRRGLRFRVDYGLRPDDGRLLRPDIVFTRQEVAIFVDGCFWHGCSLHTKTPAQNRYYWAPKIARNRERDVEQVRRLEAAGWTVLRVWEHDPVGCVADRIEQLVRRRSLVSGPA